MLKRMSRDDQQYDALCLTFKLLFQVQHMAILCADPPSSTLVSPRWKLETNAGAYEEYRRSWGWLFVSMNVFLRMPSPKKTRSADF